MKNKGFTLVELLAVLLILAFIAIIAVPQILNLIEQSKIKSLKISTESYIRAVNTSLMNEEVFNNVKDGLYTITDNGKKIVLGDKEIYIASEGHGLRSGLLLIEDSKVKRVLKGLIDDYYARVTDEDIEILKNLNESTLVNGETFNIRLKELVKTPVEEGKTLTSSTVDTIVKKIIFLQDSVLPEGLTKEELEELEYTDLSSKNDGSIKGYYDEKTGEIYVYSEGYISCPTRLRFFFYNFQGVEEIELNLIDTSNITDMSYMFNGCKLLKSIDLIGVDTSKVATMERMFQGCSSLEYLDLTNFNTSKVTKMGTSNGGMFMECSSLKEIKGIENFDTSQVKSFGSMFAGCSSLESLDLSKWDMRKAENITSWAGGGGMFARCKNLKKIKFGKNFTLENADFTQAGAKGMFNGCSSLEYLDISMFKTSKVTDMTDMFFGCINLKEIKGIENLDTSKVTKMQGMFQNCSSLKSLNLNGWDTSSLVSMSNPYGGYGMFQGCSSLTELDLRSFDTSKVTNYGNLFTNCSNLKTVKVTEGKWTLENVGLKDGILQFVKE